MFELRIGDKVKFQTTTSTRATVTYKATVRKIEKESFWVEIPEPVRKLPFPPHDGFRYAQFSLKVVEQWVRLGFISR